MDDVNRFRDIEIDSGVVHDSDSDGARLVIDIREADGLRRSITSVVLTAEQFMTLGRGGVMRVNGAVPVEFDGGDQLVDALDRLTSEGAKLTSRSIVEIRDELVNRLSLTTFKGVQALCRAMRNTTPRKVAE